MKHGDSMTWAGLKMISDASVADGIIEIRQSMDDPISRLSRDVSVWRVNTLDAQVRAGLIALGWTPPTSEQE
jgi:hypothetical protein